MSSLPCVLTGRAAVVSMAMAAGLLSGTSAVAQTSASASGSVVIESPTGGSFALELTGNVVTAIFLGPAHRDGLDLHASALRRGHESSPLIASLVIDRSAQDGNSSIIVANGDSAILRVAGRDWKRALPPGAARILQFLANFN